MLDFMDRRQRKAIRTHICRFCGCNITPGQEYIRTCWSKNGRVLALHAHVRCDALSIAYGQDTKQKECSGIDVEAWIRGTVCFQCAEQAQCKVSPFHCQNVLDATITDVCVRRAINEAEHGQERAY